MKNLFSLVLLLTLPLLSHGQLRFTKLLLKPGESFSFGSSDILVVDTLIMNDSSSIVLNRTKAENYLHARYVVIGRNCFIDGSGSHGKNGQTGRKGMTTIAPCQSGTDGEHGIDGADGGNAVDLLIYFADVAIQGKLTIYLNGGNGGHGGHGGEGGGGGSGTIHCNGGNGGNGGKAGHGGKAGDGGMLTIHAPFLIRNLMQNHIIFSSKPGTYGKGGLGGYSGYAGLGPKGKHGTNGKQGNDGTDGALGAIGEMLLQEN